MKLSHWIIVLVSAFTVVSCSVTPDEILKKYETYPGIQDKAVNKSGFSISITQGMDNIAVNFDNPILNDNEEYLNVLSERLYVADAEKPDTPLPVKTGSYTQTVTRTTGERTVTHGLVILPGSEIKSKFIIVGFKGIDKSESEELETPPMFFLVHLKADSLLTQTPLLANKLFATDYAKTRFPVYQATVHSAMRLSNTEAAYTIRIGNIGKDEQGYTFVDFLSEAVDETDWDFLEVQTYLIEPLGLYTQLRSPFFTEIKVGGKSVLAKGYAIETGVGIREVYDTKEMPDTIIVRSKVHLESPSSQRLRLRFGERIMFDGKTKEVIQ